MHGNLIRGVDAEGHTIGPVTEVDYNPLIFNVPTVADAKQVILYPLSGMTSEQRWIRETEWMIAYLDRLDLHSDSWLLDYGCGIGRLSKLAIAQYGCRVVGIDISTSMRSMAIGYVNSDRFIACSHSMCDALAPDFDAAIAVWTLQHCQRPTDDLDFIWRNLTPSGLVLVLNEPSRFVPCLSGRTFDWFDDHQDVWGELERRFNRIGVLEQFPSSQGRLGIYQRRLELTEESN
jgi:SAM-dependent methyltransferase